MTPTKPFIVTSLERSSIQQLSKKDPPPFTLLHRVETLCVDAIDVAHKPEEGGMRGLNQEMVAGGHDREARYFKLPQLCWLLEKIKECMVIGFVGKDLLGSPAMVHHVIPGIWIFYPQCSGHVFYLSRMNARVKGGLRRFDRCTAKETEDRRRRGRADPLRPPPIASLIGLLATL